MWIMRLTVSLVTLYVTVVYAKPYLLLDDVRVFVGKHFLYQIGDEQFLSIYRVYRVVERGQKSLPDWLRYVNKTSQLIGSPKSGDEGLYTIRVKAECIDPLKLRCSDRISRTFLIKVVEPLTAAESRGRKKLSPVHAGRVFKHKRPRVKITREFENQHKYTNMILPTRTYMHDFSATAASVVSTATYILHESKSNMTVLSNQSTYKAYKFDLTFPSLCKTNEVSFFASLVLHVMHALTISEAELLKNRFALFISKDSSLVFLTDGSNMLGSFEKTARKHILTAGPGNIIESLSNSVELTWHLACGGSVDKVVDFAKALQHNVDVGRLTEELGYDIIAWFIFSDKPISRRQKRDAHNKGRQTRTPSFTPPLPTTVTDTPSLLTLPINDPTLSTIKSSIEFMKTSSTFSQTSNFQSSKFSSDSSIIDTSISNLLQPSFTSHLFQTVQSSTSDLSSTSVFITFTESSQNTGYSSSTFFPSFTSQTNVSLYFTADSYLLLSSKPTLQYSLSITQLLANTSKTSFYPTITSISNISSAEKFKTTTSIVSLTFSKTPTLGTASIVTAISSTLIATSIFPSFLTPFISTSNVSPFLTSFHSTLPLSSVLSSFTSVSKSPSTSFLYNILSTFEISLSILDIVSYKSAIESSTKHIFQTSFSSPAATSTVYTLSSFSTSESSKYISPSSSRFTTHLSPSLSNSSILYPSFSKISTFSPPFASLSTINTTSVTYLSFLTPFTSLLTYSTAHIMLISSMSEYLSSLFYMSSYTFFIPLDSSKLDTSYTNFIPFDSAKLKSSDTSFIPFISTKLDTSYTNFIPLDSSKLELSYTSFIPFNSSKLKSSYASFIPFESSKLNTSLSFISLGKSSPTEIISTSMATDFSYLSKIDSYFFSTSLVMPESAFLTAYVSSPFADLVNGDLTSSQFTTIVTSIFEDSSKSSHLSSLLSFSVTQSTPFLGQVSLSSTSAVSNMYSILPSLTLNSSFTSSNISYTKLSSDLTAPEITSSVESSSTLSNFLFETSLTSMSSFTSSFISLTHIESMLPTFTSIETSSAHLTRGILDTSFSISSIFSKTYLDFSSTHLISALETTLTLSSTTSIISSRLLSSSSVFAFPPTFKFISSSPIVSSSTYLISDSENVTSFSSVVHISSTLDLESTTAQLTLAIKTSVFESTMESITTSSFNAYLTFNFVTSVSAMDVSLLDSYPISVPSSSVVLSSLSLVLPSASQTFSSNETSTAAPDTQPKLQVAIDHLEVYVGRYFELKIPEKTFNDTEDGSTSNLNLSISLVYGKPLRPDSWLQFNSSTQTLYGLPLMRDLESGQNKHVLEKFILTASDSKGQIAKDVISIAYRYDKEVTHDVTIKFEGDYSKFENDKNALIEVAQKMAKFYGDMSLKHFTIFDIVNGSVILNWGNNSLFGSKCLRREINSMYEKLVMENGTVSENFSSMFSGMDISPIFTSLELKRVCLIPLTTLQPTKPPVKTVENEKKFWLTIGLPALIVIVIIIIIALLLLICCRHRRSNKDVKHSEKPSYLEDRRPIIFPEELEMVDPSLKPKNPLILPSDYLVETPPAVPPHIGSRPPDYQAPVFDDGIFEADDTAVSPAPGIAETATDPPPYRLPPPYYNPHRAK